MVCLLRVACLRIQTSIGLLRRDVEVLVVVMEILLIVIKALRTEIGVLRSTMLLLMKLLTGLEFLGSEYT